VGITCLCRYKGGDVRLSQEHLEYAWAGYDEVCNYDMAPDIAEEIDSWDKEEIRRILL
jgi:hypothetical protein